MDTEAAAEAEGPFCLQQVTITEDSEDDYQYEEVPADDDSSLLEGDEDLAKALQTIQEQSEDAQIIAQQLVLTSKHSVSEIPEAVDDFLCNFLIRMRMARTLDCFQTERYELMQKGVLEPKDIGFVPDIYTHNQHLETENKRLKKDLENYKIAASKAKEALLKIQKERDFHRMHHKRVVQEKNRLISDIKRLKTHYASYEPTLRQLTEKYQAVLRQKMLTSLERDRAIGQVTGLQATLQNLESGRAIEVPVTRAGHKCKMNDGLEGPTQKIVQEAREQRIAYTGVAPYDPAKDPTKQLGKRYPKDSDFPVDTQVNPNLARVKECTRLLKSGLYTLSNTLRVHDLAVSCLALHPRKDVVVTASDDRLWKMWAFPNGNIIMTGEGHTDWLSGCCFHPSGTKLVTSSGDSTVRIWDFSKGECILTLEGHASAVWGCSWHSCGDFVASASMDNTSKIWDINSERCRYTMRGHKDSVNSIEFLPFSNTILTCSADKTLSLWDARTGLCAHTFYGHLHSCNHATFNLKGDTIVSCDSYGVMKLWDVRKISPMVSIDAGPHPGNQVAFDPSGHVIALASNDGTVKVLELKSGQLSSLMGHEDDVQCVVFDHKAEHLLSGGADGTVRLWT
ncbi:PREDICTED: sperm-associated antigen 16 protein isoform X1 [Crocodylus porosus]|uniref:sperm-associated antigen 16 protein isoform X1 n=1 Tax=Crocodylus porosus TaxID=8502 RepID=UPI00093C5F11|nr:PREDICTED: sperm-associated antigen 16 protein isoform X1 [Crocodylus porosus]